MEIRNLWPLTHGFTYKCDEDERGHSILDGCTSFLLYIHVTVHRGRFLFK